MMFIALAVFASVLNSCTKENVGPSDPGPGFAPAAEYTGCDFRYSPNDGSGAHIDACACSGVQYDFKDGNGNTAWTNGVDYGTILVALDNMNLNIVGSSGFNFFFSNVSIYYGPSAGVPTSGGNLNPSAFPLILPQSPVRNYINAALPVATLPPGPCNTLIVVATLVRVDFFGNLLPVGTVYLAGDPYLNGYAATYCPVYCPDVSISGCNQIIKGQPGRNCTNLSALATGGTPPFTYLWSTGATTSNVTVCPTANTTYSVSATDAGGRTATSTFAVNYIDIRCGNNGNNGSGGSGSGGQHGTGHHGSHGSNHGNNNAQKVTFCKIMPNGNISEVCITPAAAAILINQGRGHYGPCSFSDPCQ